MRFNFYHVVRALIPLTVICAAFLALGCATTGARSGDLPPLLAQDELIRPYQKVAVLEVKRERMGAPSDFSPADYSWGYEELRAEAGKIGADAVILPELKVELQHYIFFPSSEMTAKGVAIKFVR